MDKRALLFLGTGTSMVLIGLSLLICAIVEAIHDARTCRKIVRFAGTTYRFNGTISCAILAAVEGCCVVAASYFPKLKWNKYVLLALQPQFIALCFAVAAIFMEMSNYQAPGSFAPGRNPDLCGYFSMVIATTHRPLIVVYPINQREKMNTSVSYSSQRLHPDGTDCSKWAGVKCASRDFTAAETGALLLTAYLLVLTFISLNVTIYLKPRSDQPVRTGQGRSVRDSAVYHVPPRPSSEKISYAPRPESLDAAKAYRPEKLEGSRHSTPGSRVTTPV